MPPIIDTQQLVGNALSTVLGGIGGGSSDYVLLSARGTFYRVPLGDDAFPGMYAVEGLSIFTDTDTQDEEAIAEQDALAAFQNAGLDPFNLLGGSQNTEGNPVLITGIATGQTDIISTVACLNNTKVIYTYGQNFGRMVVTGEVLLGPDSASIQAGVNLLTDWFWQNRITVRGFPIPVSMAQSTLYLYLSGMDIMDVVADLHILPFRLYGTMIDLSRENASLINPSSLVITTANLDNSSLIQGLNNRKSPLPSLEPTSDNQVPDTSSENVGDNSQANGNDPNTGFKNNFDATVADQTPSTSLPNAGTMGSAGAIVTSKQQAGIQLTPEEQEYADNKTQIQALHQQNVALQNQADANNLGIFNSPSTNASTTQALAQSDSLTSQMSALTARNNVLGQSIMRNYNSGKSSNTPPSSGP